MDLTDIDYHSYCFGTIGRGVCVSMYGLIVLLYDLYIISNCCYPLREWIVSNWRTRHKANTNATWCTAASVLSRSGKRCDRRSIRYRRFRSRRLHHLHHSRRQGDAWSAVESDPILFACSKSNYLQPSLSFSSALVNNEFSNGHWTRLGSALVLVWLVGRLVGWLNRLDE